MVKEIKNKSPKTKATASFDEDAVREWLIARPDFIEKNVELFVGALLPDREVGEGVIDMQSVLVDRLRKQITDLKSLQGDLVGAARANLHTQDMVLNSVKAILAATNITHFIHILTQDLPEYLDVDVVTLCIEDGPIPLPAMTGLQRLKKGNIDKANWNDKNILMRPNAPRSKAVFGPAMDLVASDALIKLDIASLNTPAMLAIGSRQIGHFHAEQATDLLSFLATCIQSSLQMWLETTDIT
ncbi:MAG: DUF484 family protein [Pseudomonas marincola]